MKSTSNNRTGTIILSVLAVLIIFGALFFFAGYFFSPDRGRDTNDAQVEAFINPVSARVGGFIKSVRFNEHEMVEPGDTLVILDDREYRQRVVEAEAAVEDARGQLTVLEAAIASAQTATLVNKDQIAGARARFVLQKADMDRYRNLVNDEAVTGSDLDAVTSRLQVSQSDLDGSENSLKTSYARIAELRSRRALLDADLKKKKALLELSRFNLGYTVVTAPYKGRMGRKTILEGQQIQPGQALVLIVNEADKWVTANFKETQVDGMYIGQPVEIRVDAIENKAFRGEIAAIAGSTGAKFSLLPTDNSTGNFVKIIQRVPVRIKFTGNDTDKVKAGMSVTVTLKEK